MEGTMKNFAGIFRFEIVCIIMLMILTGCATYDQSVTMLYHPVTNAVGGSGELYLAATGMRPGTANSGNIKWIIGKVKYTDWRQSGDVLSKVSPNDMVLDALTREFTVAGYQVRQVNTLPEDANKGIVISLTDINLDEDSSIIKDEGSCRVTISLELWRSGNKVRKLDYQSKFSDEAIKGRDMLFLQTVLQNALQDVMKQAVPEIIRQMGN
jgi:hypothetical protein